MYKYLMAFLTCMVFRPIQCSRLAPAGHALINNPSAEAFTGIQQTFGLFPIAIDLKQFDLLNAVFVPNATANFTGHSVSVGVPTIKSYLS